VFVRDACFDGNVYIFGITFLFVVIGLKKRKKCFVLSFKVSEEFIDELSDFMVKNGIENRSEFLRRAVKFFIYNVNPKRKDWLKYWFTCVGEFD